VSNDVNHFRKMQRTVRDKGRMLGVQFEGSAFKKGLVKATTKADQTVKKGYRDSGADAVVSTVAKAAGTAHGVTKDKLSEFDKATGFSEIAATASDAFNQKASELGKRFLNEVGIADASVKAGLGASDVYGVARSLIKPYFAPESASEVLKNTQRELTYITACILQVSYKDAEGWLGEFGRLVSAKMAGIASTATLFGLVSIYGTAGTGAAIAGLSGAAATNATLSVVGGIVGGGMAAGALVLSGFGILVGIGAFKLMSSEARNFDTLPDEDKQIVNTCGILLAAIQEELDRKYISLSADEAIQFCEQSLLPFYDYLETNKDAICSRLDTKNAMAFRQRVLRDFRPVVIDGFRIFAKNAPVSINGLIGGVFYALLTRSATDGSVEETLVLDALRRSKTDLNDATEAELGDYLQEMTPEQMRGVANNVKGIYHELRHVKSYNDEHVDSYAVLQPDTNHQGSDIQVFAIDTNKLVDEYQLKATDNASYVREHQIRYPDVDVLATEEVALIVDGAGTSGLTNVEMNSQTQFVLTAVSDNSIADRVVGSAETAGLVSAGLAALKVLNGNANLNDAGKDVAGTVVNAAAATGITAYLFS
jgi:hypothetical protein